MMLFYSGKKENLKIDAWDWSKIINTIPYEVTCGISKRVPQSYKKIMDLIKHYINQSITIAANNLRLNNQQIEVVALLKEAINKSDNLSDDLINMKRITELSLLAIRLNEIYNSLTQNPIDFLKSIRSI